MIENSWCQKQDKTNQDDQIIVVFIISLFVHKNQNYCLGLQLQDLENKTTEMFVSVEIWATMGPPRLQDHQRTKIAESQTNAGISPQNVTWCKSFS